MTDLTSYQRLIAERSGDIDRRHVEAWMRLEQEDAMVRTSRDVSDTMLRFYERLWANDVGSFDSIRTRLTAVLQREAIGPAGEERDFRADDAVAALARLAASFGYAQRPSAPLRASSE